jgi:hypothetical protein
MGGGGLYVSHGGLDLSLGFFAAKVGRGPTSMNQEITLEELRIAMDDSDPAVLEVRLTGRSNMRHPGEFLRPWFDGLIARATGTKRIEIHFENLEHFNSSTIAALVQIMNDAAQAHVKLVLFYDGSLKWQLMSFEAIGRAIRPFAGTGEAAVTIQPINR